MSRGRTQWLVTSALTSLVATFVLIALLACDSSSPADTSPTGPAPSVQGSDFGPLAVVETLGGSLAGGGTGPIHIGDECVTMTRENGDELLLIWLAAQVSWDERERAITFSAATDSEDLPITLRDGDSITVGGESLEDDVSTGRELTWLATPEPNCSGEAWIVNGLTKP